MRAALGCCGRHERWRVGAVLKLSIYCPKNEEINDGKNETILIGMGTNGYHPLRTPPPTRSCFSICLFISHPIITNFYTHNLVVSVNIFHTFFE